MIVALDRNDFIRAELESLETEQLHQRFRDGLRLTVDHLTKLAICLDILEARGEQVLGVSEGLLSLLRRIARGEMLAETVVTFASTPQVMRRVGKLPIEEQQAIVEDKAKIEELLRPQPRGRLTERGILKVQGRRASGNRGRSRDAEDSPLIAASMATTKDLADLIASMLERHPDPPAVWRELCKDRRVRKLAKENSVA